MKYKKDNKILEIIQDCDPQDPRTDTENFGMVVCFHKSYDLPNDTDFKQTTYESWNELEEDIQKIYKPKVIFPIYIYDHSGITIKTTPFGCPWDSGQIGYIFATEQAMKDFGIDTIEQAKHRLIQEVEMLDNYLTGEVYGFRIYQIKKCQCCGHEEQEESDSCWGFYGSDFDNNGLYEMANVNIKEWTEI